MKECGILRKLILLLILTVFALSTVCAQAEGLTDASLLVLASAAEPMGADEVPTGLTPISTENRGVNLTTSRSMLLREEALAPLYQMMRAANRDGCTLYVRQAYRSYADEARRYNQLSASGQASQKPGESSYQTGLSVTLVGADWKSGELTAAFAQSREAQWLSAHAWKYGFVLRYPEGKEQITGWACEPWHYRYVGVGAATLMTERSLCLEELVADAALMAQIPMDATLPQDSFEDEAPEPVIEFGEIEDPENAMAEPTAEELARELAQNQPAAQTPAETEEPETEESEIQKPEIEEPEAEKPETEEPETEIPNIDLSDIGPDGDFEIHWPET